MIGRGLVRKDEDDGEQRPMNINKDKGQRVKTIAK